MEFIEFLMSRPSLAEMAAFRFSEPLEAHLATLHDAKRHGTLTPEETAELQEHQQLERILTLMKMRALEKINNTTTIG
jgi:hypothetical protein